MRKGGAIKCNKTAVKFAIPGPCVIAIGHTYVLVRALNVILEGACNGTPMSCVCTCAHTKIFGNDAGRNKLKKTPMSCGCTYAILLELWR